MTSDYDSHAVVYDVQSWPPDDIAFYQRCAREYGSPVLEIAVGTGRVAIPLAEAGHSVVGIDSSPGMLDRARQKATDGGLTDKVELVRADMRDFDLGRAFPLVIIPFRAFLHNETTDDQLRCLSAIARHMTVDSRLALAFFVPSVHIIAKKMTDTFVSGVTEYTHPESGRLTRVSIEFTYEPFSQHIGNVELHEEFDELGAGTRRTMRRLSLCWIWPREAALLFKLAGFEVETAHGGFNGEPLDEKAGEQVYVLRRAR